MNARVECRLSYIERIIGDTAIHTTCVGNLLTGGGLVVAVLPTLGDGCRASLRRYVVAALELLHRCEVVHLPLLGSGNTHRVGHRAYVAAGRD